MKPSSGALQDDRSGLETSPIILTISPPSLRQEVFAHRIPVQVLRVELAGVRPLGPGNTWSDRALEFLAEQIQDKKFHVELKDRTRQPPTVSVTLDRKFDLATMFSNLEGDFVELGESDTPGLFPE